MWLQIILLVAFCLTTTYSQCPASPVRCRSYMCPGRTSCDSFRCTGCSRPNRDPCTCLTTYKGCHIRQNSSDVIGHPTYKSVPQTTYSCINNSNVNCGNYDVHVLSTLKGNGDYISWNDVLSTGELSLAISVHGTGNKSLVLVLLNHYPVNWILQVPSGVIIEKILLSSYHVDVSSVTYPAGSVLNVEKVANILLPSLADGFDAYGDNTLVALKYLMGRFGSVSSFTGTERADRWTLSINRNPRDPGCSPLHGTATPPPQSPTPVIAAQCHPSLLFDRRGTCYINSFRPTCSGDGYCRCPNMANRDECSCLVKFGSCNVEKSATGENSAGVSTYMGRTQIISSCVASDNCQNSLHVISIYQARSNTRTGSVRVDIIVNGEDTKPLILVLTSYYSVRWVLNIPQGVIFDKVIVSSYYMYLSQTSVSYRSGSVTSIEKLSCSSTVRCYSDGYDDDTVEQLRYLSGLFGPVSTWSSAQRTDTWILQINRTAGCIHTPSTANDRTCPVLPLPFGTTTTTSRPIPDITSFGQPTRRQPSTTRPSLDSNGATSNSLVSLVIGIATAVSIILVSMLSCLLFLYKRHRPSSHLRNSRIIVQQNSPHTPQIYMQGSSSQVIAVNPPRAPHMQQDLTKSTSGTMPYGELMDHAPPSYDVALGLPPPTSNDRKTEEDPPPYTSIE